MSCVFPVEVSKQTEDLESNIMDSECDIWLLNYGENLEKVEPEKNALIKE